MTASSEEDAEEEGMSFVFFDDGSSSEEDEAEGDGSIILVDSFNRTILTPSYTDTFPLSHSVLDEDAADTVTVVVDDDADALVLATFPNTSANFLLTGEFFDALLALAASIILEPWIPPVCRVGEGRTLVAGEEEAEDGATRDGLPCGVECEGRVDVTTAAAAAAVACLAANLVSCVDVAATAAAAGVILDAPVEVAPRRAKFNRFHSSFH